MRDQGVGSWPVRRARMTPDKVALVDAIGATTYAELEDHSRRLALGLRDRGIKSGDRVAYLGHNSTALVETMFAVARLGAVFLPVNTRLAPPELAHILADSRPSLLVWQDGFEAGVQSAAVAELGLHSHRIGADPRAGMAELSATGTAPLDEEIGLDDLFMIQYTSGTSGRPKGVMLTHGNIVWNVYNLLVDIDLSSDEVALVVAPLFHTAALNQVLFPTLLKGGTALIEAKFDAGRAIELIEAQRVTLLFGVTAMYLALSQAPGWEAADLTSLRTAMSGGAPVPETLLRTWLDRGQVLIQGYGLTESSPGATMLRREDGLRKLGSAGTSCFFSDVVVVGIDGEPAAVGETGEVRVQGPNVTPGYWEQPDATRAVRDDEGWLRTGDLAVRDEEGYLRIVDRLKDMFISGGENVYPAEVEQAVYTHPAVAECAVIGVPDPVWGEVGRVVVVRRPDARLDAAGMLAHLDGRLARYKIPRSVVFADSLPRNASGKLVKAKVSELYGPPQDLSKDLSKGTESR